MLTTVADAYAATTNPELEEQVYPNMKTHEEMVGKFLQAITSVSIVLVGFIAVTALDKISDLDEKINTHIVASEHRLTKLEHHE